MKFDPFYAHICLKLSGCEYECENIQTPGYTISIALVTSWSVKEDYTDIASPREQNTSGMQRAGGAKCELPKFAAAPKHEMGRAELRFL